MAIEGFMEDWDGEMVLSDIRNFKDENDFLEQAEKYVKETRGNRVPILEPQLMNVVYNSENDEHCWMAKKYAERSSFEGETITVYKSDIDYQNAED
ncbi:hypothetical protein [Oceanobacillus sp. FSL W7-1309]|uniref:hypothetical protein n=1 Tax=Oceanobacillus sp. FSL W7-1309 TaxID=2954539 RepID=UPI0030F56145